MTQERPVVFALVGGVASGKSAVAKQFRRLGALVIDADAAGHKVLGFPKVKARIVSAFGKEVLDETGRILRSKLGRAVFGDAAKVEKLNGITHPRIRRLLEAQIDSARGKEGCRAIVLDISLLLESQAYEGRFDVLVYVDASEEARRARTRKSRGWGEEQLLARQEHQLPLDGKRALADEVVANNATLADLRGQVETIWRKYVG